MDIIIPAPKTDVRLIFTDHDGTFADNNVIPSENLEVLSRYFYKRDDRRFVDASARPAWSVHEALADPLTQYKDLAAALKEGRMMVTGFNGGLCYPGHIDTTQPHSKPFALPKIIKIHNACIENHCTGIFYSKNQTHAVGRDAWLDEIATYLKYTLTDEPPQNTTQDPIYLIDIKVPEGHKESEVLKKAGLTIWEKMRSVSTYTFLPPRNNLPDQSLWLQVMPYDVNKFEALQYYRNTFDIRSNQTFVMGDGQNDIGFLSKKGVVRAIPANASTTVIEHFKQRPHTKIYNAPSAKYAGFATALRNLVTLT